MDAQSRSARAVAIALMMVAVAIALFALTAAPSEADEARKTVIGDRVWNDKDGDGRQEVGEGGINGVGVQLLDKRNRVLASTATTGNGNYRFEGREPGVYYVRLIDASLPAGYEMTHDFDGGAAGVASLTLRPEHVRLNLDFGYREAATSDVHDVVWLDLDGDGDRDPREPGLGGVEVILVRDGEEFDRVLTRRNGYFRFDALPTGVYEVEIDEETLPLDASNLDAASVAVAIDGEEPRIDLGFDRFGIVPLGD